MQWLPENREKALYHEDMLTGKATDSWGGLNEHASSDILRLSAFSTPQFLIKNSTSPRFYNMSEDLLSEIIANITISALNLNVNHEVVNGTGTRIYSAYHFHRRLDFFLPYGLWLRFTERDDYEAEANEPGEEVALMRSSQELGNNDNEGQDRLASQAEVASGVERSDIITPSYEEQALVFSVGQSLCVQGIA